MVSDPSSYAGAQIRLVAVDMDGTLLDDEKNFPPGLDGILDQLEERGIVFVPASGRQIWTLINMFPGRAGMTFIGENGAIVMRDGREISSAPLDLGTVRRCVELVRQYALPRPGATAAREDAGEGAPEGSLRENFDGGLVVCGKESAYIERSDEPFLHVVTPYYARTQVVEDLLEVLDEIERGELDDAIIKLTLHSAGDVKALAERTLGTFKQSYQFALSGDNWADLQMRGVDKGQAVSELQKYLVVSPAQTAVFGDAGNDLGMMSHAEFSFAMANASPDILAAARFVAPSNNEAGVVQVLRALLAE
ncbi:Cof-type HAD-IIB family hydrolase [uncultured Actinomyces sp.]|uniref:Cof-type HAD-IIB family hydrolase n=1 Tax=uncultured Actinomyces sp. TaxID=249061 RepID=UPI002612200A|nr:Cof-type HAD-IIB family hydrolase [uncultured Actinomyces sp.]